MSAQVTTCISCGNRQQSTSLHLGGMMRAALLLLLISCASAVMGQSFTWSENFSNGVPGTTEQCTRWNNFLDQLGGVSFISVTISGTYDPAGITITDPAAATALATLLYTRGSGTILSDGHTWAVGGCGPASCGGVGTELVVDGDQCGCSLVPAYSIRPYLSNANWGGINTVTCSAPSQTMRLEFKTGVSILVEGSTNLCEGETVTLTAVNEKCSGNLSYLWTNGATTQTISVSAPGNYGVTVSAEGCSGVSGTIPVTVTRTLVDAGEDARFCSTPVQLNVAVNDSYEPAPQVTTNLCVFDAPGGQNNCTFTGDLCTADGYVQVTALQSFSQGVSMPLPDALSFSVYYSPTSRSFFTFRLNGNMLQEFDEQLLSRTCTPQSAGQYPKTFSFSRNDLAPYWNSESENTLTFEVSASGSALFLAGVSATIISQSEFFSWSPSAGLSDPTIRNPLASPDATTTYQVTYTSPAGCVVTDHVLVSAGCDAAPVANCKPLEVSAGNECTATVEAKDFDDGSSDPDGGALTFSVSPAGPYQLGTTDVVVTVKDEAGQQASCNTTITVTNAAPVIQSVAASGNVVRVNTAVTLTTTYADDNVTGAQINWGDQTPVQQVLNPSGTFAASHTYTTPGIYAIEVAVEDACGETASYRHDNLVVFDTGGGFVTGGGWFMSPAGADVRNPGASGKAHFEFVVKYKKKDVPEGKTNFEFKAGKLKFKSTDYTWLVAGTRTAFFMGSGKVNGSAGYNIFISVVDDAKNKDDDDDDEDEDDDDDDDDDDRWRTKKEKKYDRIRVRISDAAGAVTYDNQPGAAMDAEATMALGGGSIQIHKNRGRKDVPWNGVIAREVSSSVFPNPFVRTLMVNISSPSGEKVLLQLMDMTGSMVYESVQPYREDGQYVIDLGDQNKTQGLYFLKVIQGAKVEVIRVVRE